MWHKEGTFSNNKFINFVMTWSSVSVVSVVENYWLGKMLHDNSENQNEAILKRETSVQARFSYITNKLTIKS